MQTSQFLKRLALLALVASLVLMLAAAVSAQEGEHGEATPAGETHEEPPAGETGEAAVSPLEPLGINAGFLLVQLVNFGIIFFALTALVWRPATRMLDARSAQIQKGLEDAAAAAKARMNAEADASKVLKDAQAEAAKIISEARARGEELSKTIQAEARSAATAEAERIRADAAAARNAELAGLRDQVLNISVALATRILGESVDAKKQQALVSDFFSKVPAGAKSLSGKVEVISAMPLSDAEQAKAKKEIGASDITFSVDPSILGGLIIKSADKVIDGSVKSGLSDLASRLN